MNNQADITIDRSWVVDVRAFDAAMFDLDGVVTQTAALHAAAWRDLFDDFLKRRAERDGETFRPFEKNREYRLYIDGRPRLEGIRSFLESRDIDLPEGQPNDPSGCETIFGLGARKNELFQAALARSGVEVFDSSVAFIRHLREAGLKTAAVSSSKNAGAVLTAAGLEDLFDLRVDGVEAERLGLKGKPAPDTFVHALQRLTVHAARALGVEDSLAGVEAIRAADYGLVIGIDRSGLATALHQRGADIVVQDLAQLQLGGLGQP